MSTSYNAQLNNIDEKYTIQFETDDYNAFKCVEKACQKEIDRLNNEEEQPKMTLREAVKYWKRFLKETHDIITRDQFAEDLVLEMTDQKTATKLAISALRKQVPKQVKFSKCTTCYSGTCEDCEDDGVDKCPTCNESLSNDGGKEYDFCPYCGQALDWSRE